MKTQLPRSFFSRSAETVARDLLGAELCVKTDGETNRLRIWEAEAYVGPEDRASHASRGKTPRTAVMFGPPGQWYVYLIYGMYHMLNIVTDTDGHPGAVLIRAAGEYDGPGKLTRGLGITKDIFNATPAMRKTGLWIADGGVSVASSEIRTTPRIGVDYAGEWANAPLRFVWKQ